MRNDQGNIQAYPSVKHVKFLQILSVGALHVEMRFGQKSAQFQRRNVGECIIDSILSGVGPFSSDPQRDGKRNPVKVGGPPLSLYFFHSGQPSQR